MNKLYALMAIVTCMCQLAGCDCSDGVSDKNSLTDKSRETPSADSQADGGTLKVSGAGIDLYDVFDEAGQKKLGFTRTGNALEVPPGSYTVVLNNTRKKAKVVAGQETVLSSGALVVAGFGKDLYEVYDETGSHKLNFKYTNREMEFFDGAYVLRLNNSTSKASVHAGDKTVVEAGTVIVSGDGQDLYEVYDEAGTNKLGFAATGKALELFPGTYTVVCKQKKYTATVNAKQETAVTPE